MLRIGCASGCADGGDGRSSIYLFFFGKRTIDDEKNVRLNLIVICGEAAFASKRDELTTRTLKRVKQISADFG